MYILLKPDIIDEDHQNLPFYFNKKTPPSFGSVIVKLTYFSCVTMTTTGFGLIKPQHWATQFAVLIQMLISTLYHIVIFGLGLSRYFNTNKHQSTKWIRLSADLDDDRPRRSSSISSTSSSLHQSSSSSKNFESKFTVEDSKRNRRNSKQKKKKNSMTMVSNNGGYQHPPLLDPDEDNAIAGFVDSPGLSTL